MSRCQFPHQNLGGSRLTVASGYRSFDQRKSRFKGFDLNLSKNPMKRLLKGWRYTRRQASLRCVYSLLWYLQNGPIENRTQRESLAKRFCTPVPSPSLPPFYLSQSGLSSTFNTKQPKVKYSWRGSNSHFPGEGR